MIGIIILVVIIIFISISVALVKSIFKITESKVKRFAIIAFLAILPFWDMILHYPVYSYLSSHYIEIERYQPYKKVEGFYEDFIPNGDVAFNMLLHKTFENKYSIYFEKYAKNTGGKGKREKLPYKASWLNDSSSPTCFPPQSGTAKNRYIKYINNNWCISVEQIDKNEMTKYWKLSTKVVFHLPILYMNIYVVDFFISDRNTGEHFFRLRDIYVDKSWMTAINGVSAKKSIKSGTGYTYTGNGKHFTFPDYKIIKLLDSENLENLNMPNE